MNPSRNPLHEQICSLLFGEILFWMRSDNPLLLLRKCEPFRKTAAAGPVESGLR